MPGEQMSFSPPEGPQASGGLPAFALLGMLMGLLAGLESLFMRGQSQPGQGQGMPPWAGSSPLQMSPFHGGRGHHGRHHHGGGQLVPQTLGAGPSGAAGSPGAPGSGNLQGLHPGGGTSFTAGMAIDTDGSGNHHGDQTAQNQTSLSYSNGQGLNADTTPYFVLPPEVMAAHHIKPGDLGLVSYHGKTVAAIFGDVGPSGKLGEGSTLLAKELGINSNPNSGGTGGGVHYQVFAGSGAGQAVTPGNTTPAALASRLEAYLQNHHL
jgi:hypothetical protein